MTESHSPRAGFQTVWVQKQLKKLKAKSAALKAQFIKPTEILWELSGGTNKVKNIILDDYEW